VLQISVCVYVCVCVGARACVCVCVCVLARVDDGICVRARVRVCVEAEERASLFARVAFLIQHATSMRNIVICGLSGSTIVFNIIS
jgi:hypothetical protein